MSHKVSKKMEDQWFDEFEQDLLRRAREKKRREEEKKRKAAEDEELKRLKELHWMKCPKCGHDMKEIDISGVLVDQCVLCHGLYLDLGEMETLFSRKAEATKSFFKKLFGVGPS